MLFIVQVIDHGAPVPPAAFADQARAQAAFVALVQEHYAAAYADYCARSQTDPEAFLSARAFVEREKTQDDVRLCYWELAAAGEQTGELPAQSREVVAQAAVETQQQVLGVQTELRGLTAKLTDLSQELIRFQSLLGEEGPVAVEDSAPEEAAPAPPQELDEKYQTAEWQDFVQSLTKMCGGNWGEFPLISRQDWRQAVYSDQTALPYWEWVAITIDQAIERAKDSGYSVAEDPQQSGQFAYITPAGDHSEIFYEQKDLAWCAAGLHAAREEDPAT